MSAPASSPPSVFFLHHAGEWADSMEGSSDCLSLMGRIAEWIKLFGSESSASIAEGVRVKCDVFTSMSILPQVISDARDFYSSAREWSQSGPSTGIFTMVLSCKKVGMDGLGLVGTAAQTVLLGESLKVASLATRQVVLLQAVVYTVSLLLDGADFMGNCLELYRETKPEKRRHAWLCFVTNGTSVALAFLSLGTLFLGPSTSRFWGTRTTLTLGTVYLAAKLSSHFYKKMRVELSQT